MLRYKKHLRILNGLLNYCAHLGATEYTIDFNMTTAHSYIEVRAPVKRLSREQLLDLHSQINIPRQHEVEETYWNLSADDDTDNMLSLVGFMTDRTAVAYDDGILCIRIERDD